MTQNRFSSAATAALLACAPTGDAPAVTDAACDSAQSIAHLPAQIHEASGIALSRRHAGVLWVHNDSRRPPFLYAIDTAGHLLATARLAAPPTSDWEDIAAGPCPLGSCLYIADIGDNLHDREDRAILRIAEPDPDARQLGHIERFPVAYPEGPRDAEALFVLPDTSLYVITKGRSAAVTVYEYPPPLRPDVRVTLVRVQQLTDGLQQMPDLVTGADATPDGRTVAVRTYTHLQLYDLTGDTLAPRGPARGYSLAALGEPQGEGVALAEDGTVFLVSEAGPAGGAAPLSRMRCRFPD